MSCFAQKHPWRYTDGDFDVTRGSAWTAPGCHLGCGVLIYSRDGKVDHVEGNPANPYNQGRLCPRCTAVTDFVNHKNRVPFPMKRARENRGKDAWERITWDEAFDTIESRFNEYKSNSAPKA